VIFSNFMCIFILIRHSIGTTFKLKVSKYVSPRSSLGCSFLNDRKISYSEWQHCVNKYLFCYRPSSTWPSSSGPSSTRTSAEATTWNGECRQYVAEYKTVRLLKTYLFMENIFCILVE
jgi:hypothetical protein